MWTTFTFHGPVLWTVYTTSGRSGEIGAGLEAGHRRCASSAPHLRDTAGSSQCNHSRRSIAMHVQPYLFFEGRCEEALEFYRKTIGAEVLMLMRYKDHPAPGEACAIPEHKVMHSCFRIGETSMMASDGPVRASRASRASRSRSLRQINPRQGGYSIRWATADRCKCRSRRRSSRRASACLRTASACPGWSWCSLDDTVGKV